MPRAIRETFIPDEPNRAYCTAPPQAVALRMEFCIGWDLVERDAGDDQRDAQ
jgi:hypothetical protein